MGEQQYYVGNRVQFVADYGSDREAGDTGTVTGMSGPLVIVEADIERNGRATTRCYPRRLALIDDFRIGDRLRLNEEGQTFYLDSDTGARIASGVVVAREKDGCLTLDNGLKHIVPGCVERVIPEPEMAVSAARAATDSDRAPVGQLARFDGVGWVPVKELVDAEVVEEESARDQVLATAKSLINGERSAQYGGARPSFQRIADLWTALLGVTVQPWQVASCMAAMKLARLAETSTHADSWVDVAGYAALGYEVASTEGDAA